MSRVKLHLFLLVVASPIISPIPGDKYLVVKLPANFPAITQGYGNSSSQGMAMLYCLLLQTVLFALQVKDVKAGT